MEKHFIEKGRSSGGCDDTSGFPFKESDWTTIFVSEGEPTMKITIDKILENRWSISPPDREDEYEFICIHDFFLEGFGN